MTATTTVAPEVAERVAAGAAWLDEIAPGWWRLVDLDRLQMASCVDCVLGQLFGDYDDVPMDLDEKTRLGFDADRAGLILAEDHRYVVLAARYAALAAEWMRVIRARRGVPAAEGACCPCTGEVCDPGCECPDCPHDPAEVTDDAEL